MNTSAFSRFNQARIEWAIRLKYSPLPELDMELLTRYRNAARIGELRDVGKIWEVMVEIDGELGVNADKRASDLASLGHDVVSDGSAIGDAHKEALQYFYRNLTATEALDQDEVGGVSQLVYHVCHSAHLYKYSVHEMLMRIDDAGAKQVTCEFRHTPVWFMESRRGYLGYLQHIFDLYGQPCIEGEWLTCVGRGWMRALMTAFAIKWFPMRDWLLFCQRYGSGFLIGETSAEPGTPEWNNGLLALETLSNDATALVNNTTNFKFLEQSQKNHTPFEPLVERVDRLYSKCLRGVDLATSSRGGSSAGGASGGGGGAQGGKPIGANMQQEESGILLSQDVPWLNGYFNRRIDRPIIRYLFNQEPRARFQLLHGEEEQQPDAQDTQTWVDMGLAVSIKQARERTGWREPEDQEPILAQSTPPPMPGAPADGEAPGPGTGAEARKGVSGGAPKTAPEAGALPEKNPEPPRYKKTNWKPAKKPDEATPAKTDDNTPIASGADPKAVQGPSTKMPDTQVDAAAAWSRTNKPLKAADGSILPMPSLGYALPNASPEVIHQLATAHVDDLAPIIHEYNAILGIENDALFLKKMREFVAEHGPMMRLLPDINANPRAAKVLQQFTTEQLAAALTTNKR